MKFLSVCSGIEAASVAWRQLGWQAVGFAEIEKFPSAVLAHHYPGVPNYGDMTKLPGRIRGGEIEAPDLLCGGTPCQAFSVAGMRRSLGDARGNLSLTFCEIANAIDAVRVSEGDEPCVVFWENVLGVLSTKDNAFGCFLAGLAGEGCPLEPPGGKWTNAGVVLGPQRAVAWRVLDAQYFGVAQRRRRVFVVASARNGFDPAAVLFESDCLRRDSAPRREARKIAPTLPARSSGGGGLGTDLDIGGGLIPSLARCDTAGEGKRQDYETCTMVVQGTQDPCVDKNIAFALGRNSGQENVLSFDTTEITSPLNYSRPTYGAPCHPLAASAHVPAIAFTCKGHGADVEKYGHDASHANAGGHGAVAVQASQSGVRINDPIGTLDANYGSRRHNGVMQAAQVRRLTPVECERLQGFHDGYSRIPWRGKRAEECPDGPRYKALGNSWAVPCVTWIGMRIQLAIEVLS